MLVVIFQISSIFLVPLTGQSVDTITGNKFTGELFYEIYTQLELFEATQQTLEVKSFLERPVKQIHSYQDDILITAISIGDTLHYSLCNNDEMYTVFPTSKRKLKFKKSGENDIANYTRTDVRDLISGFNCIKYYFQVNDNVLIEKWITPDFDYDFPLDKKDHCNSVFSEEGLEVARKSTVHHKNGDIKFSERILDGFKYQPAYGRPLPKAINDERDIEPVEYKIPDQKF